MTKRKREHEEKDEMEKGETETEEEIEKSETKTMNLRKRGRLVRKRRLTPLSGFCSLSREQNRGWPRSFPRAAARP